MSYRVHGLHPYLKLATAAAHSTLERILATRNYFDSRDGYLDYLRRFLAFHEEAERYLDAASADQYIPDWKDRRRAHFARRDLQALGATERLLAGPSGRLPELSGVEQVLGVAYVLEGSTLGGAFLLKQLAPLGIDASHGGSYLASYDKERGRMWQRFLATLEEAHVLRAKAESVAGAALCAFNAARYFLTEAPGLTEASSLTAASEGTLGAATFVANQLPARARSMVV
jgi:heme oxygenase